MSGLDRHASWSFPVPEFRFNATDRFKTSRHSLSRCTYVAFSNDDAVMNSQRRDSISSLQLKHGTHHRLCFQVHEIKDIGVVVLTLRDNRMFAKDSISDHPDGMDLL